MCVRARVGIALKSTSRSPHWYESVDHLQLSRYKLSLVVLGRCRADDRALNSSHYTNSRREKVNFEAVATASRTLEKHTFLSIHILGSQKAVLQDRDHSCDNQSQPDHNSVTKYNFQLFISDAFVALMRSPKLAWKCKAQGTLLLSKV